MMRCFLNAKIHRATVTAADLDYVGSITLDAELMDAAGIAHLEQVDVYDVTRGTRLTTYALRGEPGSGEVQINGAAAHLVHPGDLIIIAVYAWLDEKELPSHHARIVLVDENNRITDVRDDRPGLA